jgi:hypothetical protein
MTKVVNIYKEEFDVYCGRKGQGQDGYFGNPFKISETRELSIIKFKEYFYQRINSDAEYKRRVNSLFNKRLGCFCKPEACHVDVIVDYLNTKHFIKLGVIGSRIFDFYEILKEELTNYNIATIVSGGAKGADSLAKKYSEEYNIPIIEYLPQWNVFGNKAGFIRNELIVKESDELIAFWDGESKGTLSSIKLAEKHNKKIKVINYLEKIEEILDF